MRIEIIKCLQDNYSYLLIDDTKNIGCVVDPGEAAPIIKYVESNNIELKYILNTHHHYDHVGGNLELKKRYNSKIVGFKDDKDRIPEIDVLVEDNQKWKGENLSHSRSYEWAYCLSFFFGKNNFYWRYLIFFRMW